jgi:hypothetical protein
MSLPGAPIIDLPVHDIQNMVVTLPGMRNDAIRAILDTVLVRKITFAFEQVQRTPAEEAGFPVFEVVAGVEGAVVMREILVVHDIESSRENSCSMRSSGFGLEPTHPPSHHGVAHDSGFNRVFVPFTAAGQREIFTPLPLILVL